MKINIPQADFGTLCICALRYCHGRRTYMPSLVTRIVEAHLREFSDKDIAVMVEDCQFQRRMNLYGDDCDKVTWFRWEEIINAEMERRKNEIN